MWQYLRPNVVVEPLVERWYAWAHLLSPAAAAMNVLNRHVVNMRSYIRSPAIHQAAASNPALIGGPFFSYQGDRSTEVQELLAKTLQRQSKQIEFAEAVHELTKLLLEDCDGGSLETIYDRIPRPLRGLVELIYDIDHRPTFRFFEPLLYKTEYTTDKFQEVALYTIKDDSDRDFILSTPRLRDDRKVFISVPFAHASLDELAAARYRQVDVNQLAERLNVNLDDRARFDSLFTDDPPTNRWVAVSPGEVRVRYFGHACLLIETSSCSILTDPVFSYEHESTLPRYTIHDLPPRIDYVIITHNHQDHVIFEALLQIRHRVECVVVPRDSGGDLQDPSLKLMFSNLGFSKVVSLSEFEKIEISGGSLTGVPFMGEHGDLNVRSKLCYLVEIGTQRMLLAVDTRVIDGELYRRVSEVLGSVDTVFLGMECAGAPLSYLYAPLMTTKLAREYDAERRLNGSNFIQARRLVECFSPSNVYVYALGQEPWLQYIMGVSGGMQSEAVTESDQLIAYCQSKAIDAERLFAQREWKHAIRSLE